MQQINDLIKSQCRIAKVFIKGPLVLKERFKQLNGNECTVLARYWELPSICETRFRLASIPFPETESEAELNRIIIC